MKLEDQVVSLELAKKLKELGVKQESLFEWSTTQNGQNISLHETLLPSHRNFNSPYYKSYSAFTASELWELLPKTSHDKNSHILSAFKMINQRVGYGPLYSSGETLVEAMAKLLIKLLENKLITL